MMILFMNKSTVKKLINNIKRLMIEYNNKNQIADTELLISKLKNKIFIRILIFNYCFASINVYICTCIITND